MNSIMWYFVKHLLISFFYRTICIYIYIYWWISKRFHAVVIMMHVYVVAVLIDDHSLCKQISVVKKICHGLIIYWFKFYSKVFEIFPLPLFCQTVHQRSTYKVVFWRFFCDLVRAFCTKPVVGNLQLDSHKLVCCWVTSNVQYFDFFLPQDVRWCYFYFNVTCINRKISNL